MAYTVDKRSEGKCPEDVLLSDDHDELCHWLCVCVSELRKEDGSEYTPRSLAQFIAGLQRYIDKKEGSICLCNPDDPTFKQLHRTLDSRYRQLYVQGIGAKRRHAEVLTNEEEDQLWDSGTMSTESPSGLCVLFSSIMV